MNSRYDLDQQLSASTGRNLFIWKFVMGNKVLTPWRLTEAHARPEYAGLRVTEYYWEHAENKEQAVKIDVFEAPSFTAGKNTLQNILQNHMMPQLPEVKENRPGDIAFTGSGALQHIVFMRANMVVIANSIGNKDVSVLDVARKVDELFYHVPDQDFPDRSPLSVEARKETLQDKIRYQIDIRLAEPYTGNVWFKLVTENTEIVEEEDKLLLVPERPEGNRLSVFAIIENVPVAGKTITL